MKHRSRFHQYVIHIGRWTIVIGRWAWYASAVALVLLAVLFSAARIWLPVLAEKKDDIERYLSSISAYQIRIEKLDTYWDGLHPGLELHGLGVYVADSVTPALRFKEVRVSLALLPLLHGSLEVDKLVVVHPRLSAERLADGQLRIVGFAPLVYRPGAPQKPLALWLSRLHNLAIENGELQWFDHMGVDVGTNAAIHISEIKISLKTSADRYRLGINARLPTDICGDCSMVVDALGNPFAHNGFTGRLFVRAVDFKPDRLPLIVRERLPAGLGGGISMQLLSEFSQGRPRSAQGSINAAELSFSLPGVDAPLLVNHMDANFAWKQEQQGWLVDMTDLTLGLRGPAWTAGHFRLKYHPDESLVQVRRLNLDDAGAFLKIFRLDVPTLDYVAQLNPTGVLRNFKLELRGHWGAPKDFLLRTDLVGVGVQQFRKFPGVRNLSGRLVVSKESGELTIDSFVTSAILPHVFRSPLDVRRVSGRVVWENKAETWEVTGEGLRVFAEDINGTGRFRLLLPHEKSLSPSLEMRVDFRDGNAGHASRYYPVNITPKGLLAWLDRAIVAGKIKAGHAIYEGKLREFPFTHGGGRFEVKAYVENGVVDYLPQWAPIEQADVILLFRGSEMLITASKARISELDVSRVVVRGADLGKGSDKLIEISGEVIGPVNSAVEVLRDSQRATPDSSWAHILDPALRGAGSGGLSLNMNFLATEPSTMRMNGTYRTDNGALKLPLAQLEAEDIEGSVIFNEIGVREGRLTGRMLGGAATVEMSTPEHSRTETLVTANGVLTARGLVRAFGRWMEPYVEGSAPWHGSVRWSGRVSDVQSEADFTRFQFKLPPPLTKPYGMPLVFSTKSITGSPDLHLIDLSLGELMNGKLAFEWKRHYWAFWGGELGLARAVAETPRQAGVYIKGKSQRIDADAWLRALQESPGEGAELPEFLVRMSGDFGAVDLFDRRVGSVSVDLARHGENWGGPIEGDSVAGTLGVIFDSPVNSVTMELKRLTLPFEPFRESSDVSDPRAMPNLSVKSDSFRLGDMQGGALDLLLQHQALGWELSRLSLSRPEMTLSATGKWQRIAGRDAASLSWWMKSKDMGQTLAAMGSPDQVAEGRVEVNSELSWKGGSWFGLDNLSGNLRISAKDGRFLTLEPGAGRLMGLFDVSAIGRYMTLDFSPLFGKGFVFDRLKSQVTIETGNAHIHEMVIKGPSADVHISGKIGLISQDYDLVVGVNPSMADTLAIATWGLGAPQLGALILLIKNAFKKPIAKGTRITYTVKGAWDNPVVNRMGRRPSGEQEIQSDSDQR